MTGRLSQVRVPTAGIAAGDHRLFDFERHGEELTGIAYKDPTEGWKVYVNRCPHVNYSLDFGDGELLSDDGKFFMCMSHGAFFLPESGECFMGPPRGQRLEALPFHVHEDALLVDILPEPAEWPNLPEL